MFSLDGKVALVTGAASGIGAATARLFADAGADLSLGWYKGDPHDVEPVIKDILRSGRRAVSVEANIARAGEADRTVAMTLETLGKIDIVVANAAILRVADATELSDNSWKELMDINLLGVFRCFRAALPHMIEARAGRLLATSSTGAIRGWPRAVHYCAAKAGIIGLVQALAVDVGRHGITVNAVVPGTIVTPQSMDPVNSLGLDGLQEFERLVPVGRNGRPEDVAAAFVYLASDEAAFVSGQTLVVDGGFSASAPLELSSLLP
jgi:3-oxoacyl-[acyl-carrier protein] reductase